MLKRFSGSVFNAEAGGRVWNGAAFVPGVARLWNGTEFVPLSDGGAPPAETFYILGILTEGGDRLLQEQ